MVLLGNTIWSRGYGACKAPINGAVKIDKLNTLTIKNLLFNLCKACQINTMSAFPPSAFSAARIRETQRDRDMKLANNMKKVNDSTKFFETAFGELSPLKYNSKLMNSIWGLYNRYSPHNVKKINEAFVFNGDLQQSAANSIKNGEAVISLPSRPLDNVWATVNVSQSH
ncbi:uncharacterized protein LOC135078928 [Ostrinia nubilalis]|uniref:uncharacterized protein LOC135078928 n=1 Tax=Ostrinia nubilalis TaxID=29057 RepID=UPI0030824A98